MKVIVAGAGKLGRRVAEIIKDKQTVVVIERNESRAKYIEGLLNVRVVQGDACDPSVLLDAGADHADVVIAATGEDEDNLVLTLLAKYEFKVRKVVGAVRNPKNEWLYNRSWGVDVGIDSAQIVAKIVEEEASLRDLVTLLKLREGEVSVVELTVPATSKALGKTLEEIDLPDACVVAAVLRQTNILVPSADLQIMPGDEILFITRPSVEDRLNELLC